MKTARLQIRLTADNVRPLHIAPYHAALTARQFAGKEKQNMFQEEVIRQASREGTGYIVFVPKEIGSQRFYAGYLKLNVVIVRESYPLPRGTNASTTLEKTESFQHKKPTPRTGRLRLTNATDHKRHSRVTTNYSSLCKCHSS